MIIDLRTRIWSSLDQLGPEVATRLRQQYAERWEQLDGSGASHERATTCANGSCVFGFRSALLGAAIPNELVAEFVARDPQRLVGIAGIDPMAPDAADELEKAIHLGLAGVAMSPALQGFHPTHSAAMQLYERCDELNLPLFVTTDLPLTQSSILEFARPAIFDEIARSFPTLRIVIGEMGHPYVHESLALIGKHPHLYADVSGLVSRPWELYSVLLSATHAEVMDKVLFGSGFPFDTPAHAIEVLYSVNGYSQGTQLPSIPRSLIRAIVERDSLELLGIDSEIGSGVAAISIEPDSESMAVSLKEESGDDDVMEV